MGTQPTVWNDPDGTPALRTQLLWDIRRQQSPGDIHIMDALRTPAGRQVLNVFILYASLHQQLDTKMMLKQLVYFKILFSANGNCQGRAF